MENIEEEFDFFDFEEGRTELNLNEMQVGCERTKRFRIDSCSPVRSSFSSLPTEQDKRERQERILNCQRRIQKDIRELRRKGTML